MLISCQSTAILGPAANGGVDAIRVKRGGDAKGGADESAGEDGKDEH